ncbi:5-oxoprolinase subunit PxpB [Allomuricauda sp. SCSIO 65647]|uniref:5-oxoprolinase subunit PxpB n=1 Tax=Allomuricauda sp. SCSIO 65647 TaxID=2908843 RepID=UPI001F17E096|nr:5-oxoprolinase subunit PxpB [Muricauda sp. SCSIO 65647]UJH67491.1 5-oxoprolinase subunit PxpB [Muricauda sp. SCSIO 65647]
MKSYPIKTKPFGEYALLIEWPKEVDEHILKDILAFEKQLRTEWPDLETVPAYNSLTIISNGDAISTHDLRAKVNDLYHSNKDGAFILEQYLWTLPVCYDAEFGLDLKMVADHLNLTVDELIAKHTGQEYTVFGIGFLPGFMYLGGLPKSLEIARRTEPRMKVVKGSVGLAGKQTGIYPQESPGGWNIIGNCPIPMFDPGADEPCKIKVGDKIRFQSITRDEYNLHKIEGEIGIFNLKKTTLHA